MNWETKKLEAVADFCLGKMLDQKKNRGEPLPYLANVNVRWGEFNLADLREMRFEQHEIERYGLKYGDIVMCEGGEPGRCAIWKYQRSSMMIQKALHRIRPYNCLKPEFLYYFFLYKGRTGHLSPLFTGSTIKHLPREKLALVEVPVPPHSTQDHITSVLSAYDDLIENNRRRIQLLEQAARLLYNEWFVRLRFPGHEHVKIKDGVPEGWERKKLGEVAPLSYGKGLKEEDRIPGSFPVFGSSGIVGTHEKSLAQGPGIIVGRKGNVGSVFWSENDFYPIDTVYFIGRDKSSLYLYYSLLHTSFMSTDVAVPGLNRNLAQSRQLLIADPKLKSFFEEIVASIHKQLFGLRRYNTSLGKARDLLLPRFMNGEIAV
jgi:type I restriction enzyme, S subunit